MPANLKLELAPQHHGKTPVEVLELFDQEIEKFSSYMSTVGDWRSVGPLNGQERALLKTFLVHKYRGHIDGETNASASNPG